MAWTKLLKQSVSFGKWHGFHHSIGWSICDWMQIQKPFLLTNVQLNIMDFHPLPKFHFGEFCWWQRSMNLWHIIIFPSSLLFLNCFFFNNTNRCDLRTRPQNTDCRWSSFPSLKVLFMIGEPSCFVEGSISKIIPTRYIPKNHTKGPIMASWAIKCCIKHNGCSSRNGMFLIWTCSW